MFAPFTGLWTDQCGRNMRRHQEQYHLYTAYYFSIESKCGAMNDSFWHTKTVSFFMVNETYCEMK